MMLVSRLVSSSVWRCSILRNISSTCPHLAVSEPESSKYDNYVTVARQPAKKMKTVKNYQKFWVCTISGCWVVNAVSSVCWHVYEPLTFGMYSNIAFCASLMVIPGLFTQFLLSKIIGKVSVNTESGKLTISHLDAFGNRINKEFNASQCYFKMADTAEICYLPDGKYIAIWRGSTPEEKELLQSMTASEPVPTNSKGPDKKKAYVYFFLVVNTTIGLLTMLSIRVANEEYKKQQLKSKI